jgi:hypothetical protein
MAGRGQAGIEYYTVLAEELIPGLEQKYLKKMLQSKCRFTASALRPAAKGG